MINDPLRLHGGDFERARAPMMEIPRRSNQRGSKEGVRLFRDSSKEKNTGQEKRYFSVIIVIVRLSLFLFGDSTICAIVEPVAF